MIQALNAATLSRISQLYHSAVKMKDRIYTRALYPNKRPLLIGLGIITENEQSEWSVRFAFRTSELLLKLGAAASFFFLFLLIWCIAWNIGTHFISISPIPETWKSSLHLHTEHLGGLDGVPIPIEFYLVTLSSLLYLACAAALYLAITTSYDFVFTVPPTPRKPFILFLRSFFIESTIKGPSPKFPLAKLNKSLFREIRKAIEPTWAIVKIGSRQLGVDFDGSTVLAHDETWEERFLELAAQSERIIMVPIAWQEGAGTLKEIEHIVTNGLLTKTIFVVPPPVHVLMSPTRGVGIYPHVKDLWAVSREFLREKNILELPEYFGRSGLLVVRDGQWHFMSGGNGRYWNSHRAFRDVLLHGSPFYPPARNALRFANRLTVAVFLFWVAIEIVKENSSSIFDAIRELTIRLNIENWVIANISGGLFALSIIAILVAPLFFAYRDFCRSFLLKKYGSAMLALGTFSAVFTVDFIAANVFFNNSDIAQMIRLQFGGSTGDIIIVVRLAGVWLVGYAASYAVLRGFDLRLHEQSAWRWPPQSSMSYRVRNENPWTGH